MSAIPTFSVASALVCALLALSTLATALPASATSVALAVDPATSHAGGDPLSGSLVLEVALPLAGANAALELVSLALSTGGGFEIELRDDVAAPGLGVLSPAGAFLIPLLFVRVAGGGLAGPENLTLVDVTGTVDFDTGGADPGGGIVGLHSTFQIDTAGGPITVRLDAVPEPGTGALVLLGTAGLACARPRRSSEVQP